MVGSSRKTSSRRLVLAVAASIEAVGDVTVSERKSKAAGPGAVQAFVPLEGMVEKEGLGLGV